MGLLRFSLALICGHAVDALLLVTLLPVVAPIPAALVIWPVGLTMSLWMNETPTLGRIFGDDIFNRRRLRPTISLASALKLGLYAALVLDMPTIHPVTLQVLCAMATFAFTLFGYWRFFNRNG
ncbi:hypothetical protein [Ciceribacter sp. RN22]|uniref:hypothetical protein n=1 Tax=Ciceribacter sp. RN22 TaxID=2954932 RepID=UPI0020929A55|nr:hypothetical protein [Ciceribacter sp. RN22]MCO6176836.1 hypothetical protein [Ciceribacter sp. RN22]